MAMTEEFTEWYDPDDYAVDVSGYQTTAQLVEGFTTAGVNLQKARNEGYYEDPEGKNDDLPMPPHRSPNYDVVDAHADMEALEAKYKATEAAFEAYKKEVAAKEKAAEHITLLDSNMLSDTDKVEQKK